MRGYYAVWTDENFTSLSGKKDQEHTIEGFVVLPNKETALRVLEQFLTIGEALVTVDLVLDRPNPPHNR